MVRMKACDTSLLVDSTAGATKDAPGGKKAHGRKTSESSRRTLPLGPSFMVRRTQLIQDIVRQVAQTGIGVLCAPVGFGKTALLIQYADEIANDPERGAVRVIDAADSVPAELSLQLESVMRECAHAQRPAVAIDNLPAYCGEDADELAQILRGMRADGVELVVACTPAAREMVGKLGDAAKFSAQRLIVQPREYADWSRTLAISDSLDVYGLTQGIPSILASLQGMTGQTAGVKQPLEHAVNELYQTILDELSDTDEERERLAATLLLMGSGSFTGLACADIDVTSAAFRSLMREYPAFGEDRSAGTFTCLGSDLAALRQVRDKIARGGGQLVRRVARALLKVGRCDRAVALIDEYLPPRDATACVESFPLLFAARGHAKFVSSVVAERGASEPDGRASVALDLAVYASALTVGDYRLARAVCGELRGRTEEVSTPSQRRIWWEARSFARVLCRANGIDLPEIHGSTRRSATKQRGNVELLGLHQRSYEALIERGEWSGEVERLLERAAKEPGTDDEVNIPLLLLKCDAMLAAALLGSIGHIDQDDAALAVADRVLRERKLAPLVSYARLVRCARRMLAGAPLIDERAFTDAGNTALRSSDLSLQLLSTVFAGWQELVQGQAVNARFRAQQVLKLADEHQPYLHVLAEFLESIAQIRNASRTTLREEAGALDLTRKEVTPAEGWSVACLLSAARSDAELAAWCSMHKDALFEPSFRLFARLAINVLGSRADAVRRFLPMRYAPYYLMDDDEPAEEPLFQLMHQEDPDELGKITIRLLGGFSVTKNGHVLTDTAWKRRKAGVLLARLAVEQGAFVTRRTITEELWPELDYKKARDNLYSALSALRQALGQRKDGPQYILTQGDGVSLNGEYVESDAVQFSELAREILLGHLRMSSAQVIALCLKAESLYAGSLFVPEKERIPYFTHMGHVMQTKFIDCMLRGIDVAVEEEDTNSALWMIEAALRHGAGREDVVRRALQVYDLVGRYGDVEDVYRSHRLFLLEHGTGEPDIETQRVYRQISGKRMRYGA